MDTEQGWTVRKEGGSVTYRCSHCDYEVSKKKMPRGAKAERLEDTETDHKYARAKMHEHRDREHGLSREELAEQAQYLHTR
jgi:hypothetical protein